MLIDRSHKNWILFTLGAAALSLGAYALHRQAALAGGGTGPSGASVPGLIWGSLALAIMIFCCLLALRKKVRIWRLGRAQDWMRAHIWLGLLTIPLVFCHSGMKWGNHLTLVLMILFGIVIVSGVAGLVLQNMIPAMLLDRVKAEATFEQIEHVYELLRGEADEIVTGVCGPLDAKNGGAAEKNEGHAKAPAPAAAKAALAPAAAAKAPAAAGPVVIEFPKTVAVSAGAPELPKRHATLMVLKNQGVVQGKTPRERGKVAGPVQGAEPLKALYLKEVRPFLDGAVAGSKLATSQGSISVFEYARTLLPNNLHEVVDDLASICEERRQLAVQHRLHIWLHGWLFVHGPLSYLLLLLALIHAVVAPLWY